MREEAGVHETDGAIVFTGDEDGEFGAGVEDGFVDAGVVGASGGALDLDGASNERVGAAGEEEGDYGTTDYETTKRGGGQRVAIRSQRAEVRGRRGIALGVGRGGSGGRRE